MKHKRGLLISATVCAVVLGVSGVVVASGFYNEPGPNPGDEVGTPEAPGGIVRDEAELPPVPQDVSTDSDKASMPEVQLIQDAVGASGEFAGYWEVPEAEAVQVAFVLPNGDFISANAQRRTSVSRPGSHIQQGWVVGQFDGWESARQERDARNLSEHLWVLTDHYQIGVTLSAPIQVRLASPVGSGVVDDLMRRIALTLEQAAASQG